MRVVEVEYVLRFDCDLADAYALFFELLGRRKFIRGQLPVLGETGSSEKKGAASTNGKSVRCF
jgi:hypothetical protein